MVVSPSMNEEFMAQINGKLSARQLQDRSPVSQVFTRKQIEQAFIESFELVGGVPRLAMWAHDQENYGDFLSMLIKLAPKDMGEREQGQTFEYRSNVPQSPLNAAPAGLAQITEAEFEEIPHAENDTGRVSYSDDRVPCEIDGDAAGGAEAVYGAASR